MKKILILLTAIIIFIYPVHNAMYPQYADAAVASKAATLTAKKIVKEVIQEAAVNQAANFALLQAMEIAGKYEAKAGYKIVCPDGGSTCDKPIQVKETLTETDKTAIKAQSETELDKLISPDGKGFTKWQKFMDWFLPVWLVTFAASALTYAIDSDFRSLINEAGYNALVALGIVTDITSTEIIPLDEVQADPTTVQPIPIEERTVFTNTKEATSTSHNYYWSGANFSPTAFDNVDMLYETIIDRNITTSNVTRFARGFGANADFLYNPLTEILTTYKSQYGELISATIAIDGQTVERTTVINTSNDSQSAYFQSTQTDGNLYANKITSIRSRSPYKIGEFYYTDILWNTVDGKVYELQIQHTSSIPTDKVSFGLTMSLSPSSPMKSTHIVYTDKPPNKRILPPVYEESEQIGQIMQSSSYTDENNKIALIPPTAIPYKEESTGQTVYRVPNSTGDGAVFQKEDGTIVPEENIVPDDPPEVVKNPEGVPQVTPSPTPSNPAPEPIPLTPAPNQSTPENPTGQPVPVEPPAPPPIETTEPYFPEGENCSEGLKIPKFLPLLNTISETFPFSIPFDLYGGFEALFVNMGSERPEFTLEFDVNGKQQSWDISMPPMFDEWKKFTDSLLIFIFDIGIIWAIFRFTGGGK